MIAIIDYDAGNLKSVEKAFAHLGEDAVITRDRDVLLAAKKVILPEMCIRDRRYPQCGM